MLKAPFLIWGPIDFTTLSFTIDVYLFTSSRCVLFDGALCQTWCSIPPPCVFAQVEVLGTDVTILVAEAPDHAVKRSNNQIYRPPRAANLAFIFVARGHS